MNGHNDIENRLNLNYTTKATFKIAINYVLLLLSFCFTAQHYEGSLYSESTRSVRYQ